VTVYALGLDCSVRLAPGMAAEAKRAGYAFVIRYLYPDPSAPKALTALEADTIRAAGLGLGLVWETSAGRALEGAGAGLADARSANAIADGLGPAAAGAAIYYACDTDASAAQTQGYYGAVADVPTSRGRGAYGGVPVLLGAQTVGVPLAWVSSASSWSHGQTMNADLFQQLGDAPGVSFSADVDTATSPDPGIVPALVPPAPAPQEGHTMLELTIDGIAYLFYVEAGTLWYRSIRSGAPQPAIALSTEASLSNPLLIGQATAYGPIVYGAANDTHPGQVIRVTLIPGGWGLRAEVL
jgi:hypothetical protein